MSQKTFNEMAMEMLRIYFSCHPDKLPADEDKALKELLRLHGKFKNELIERGIRRNEDFFSDKV